MTKKDWKQVKYFSKREGWGDPDRMNPILIFALDKLREMLGIPIFVSSGTGGKHKPRSSHYDGDATDDLFPTTTKSDLFDIMLRQVDFQNLQKLGFILIGGTTPR